MAGSIPFLWLWMCVHLLVIEQEDYFGNVEAERGAGDSLEAVLARPSEV